MKDFPIIIPWRASKKLGECMNDAMEKVDDWVLFMDHDVLQLNPKWYLVCQEVIEKVGHAAGWISCLTNAIGCHWQRYADIDTVTDLRYIFPQIVYYSRTLYISTCRAEYHYFFISTTSHHFCSFIKKIFLLNIITCMILILKNYIYT